MKSVGRGRGADGDRGRTDEKPMLQRWIGTFGSQGNAARRCQNAPWEAGPVREAWRITSTSRSGCAAFAVARGGLYDGQTDWIRANGRSEV